MAVLARTRVHAASLGNTFRRELQAIDPDLPVREIRTLDDQLALSPSWAARCPRVAPCGSTPAVALRNE